MRRLLALSFCLVVLLTPAFGQMNWGLRSSIGVEKKIAKGFDAGLEARYHQTDNFQSTDRWSIGFTLSKRLYRNDAKTFNVKASVGYKYMNVYHAWSTKYKGDLTTVEDGLDPQYYLNNYHNFNLSNSYVDSRDRATVSLQASYEIGRFKIALRECYQYTYTDSVTFSKEKYRYKNDAWKPVEIVQDGKSASQSQMLRSKISLDYDIPHWKYDPFISYELFNSIDNGFKADKSRITAGVEFSFNKKHNFDLAYMWQNQHDDDEPAGSFICIGCKFDF